LERKKPYAGNPISIYYAEFEVFTAVTMKNVVFWDIKTQFVLHRRHTLLRYRDQPVRFEVFTAVT
jgi:hypothetical protein